MIKKLLEIESASLQKITNHMTKNFEISPKIGNLDLTLFRIRNFSKFVDLNSKTLLQ
jgi:hypothetical protein